jgi:hypothetical protein
MLQRYIFNISNAADPVKHISGMISACMALKERCICGKAA